VITTASAPSGSISPANASICTGGSQLLTATGGDSYQWSRDGSVITGATNATYTATQAGTYSVMIISGTCSGPASNTSVITLASAPPGIQYSSIQVQKDRPFTLSARNIGTKYNWSPLDDLDNPRSSTPVVKTSQDRSYNIAITLDNGCTVTDTLNVQIAKGSNVFVPGAFTPDKNGFNDILRPLAVNIRMNYFRIFNRWGQLMYETKVAGEGWNGEFKGLLQPVGVYLWIFEGTDTDGKIFKSTGTTILIK
jgi:gliding motility-associated-like protein